MLLDLPFKPSVIAVTETWLTHNNYFLHDIPGYIFIHKNSSCRSGGTGLFVKEDLDYEVINKYEMDISKCENMWISCKLEKNKTLVIGTIYRHNDNDFNLLEHQFISVIDKLNSDNKKYLIGGDFNFDLNKDNNKVFDYIKTLRSYGCLQTVKDPDFLVQIYQVYWTTYTQTY